MLTDDNLCYNQSNFMNYNLKGDLGGSILVLTKLAFWCACVPHLTQASFLQKKNQMLQKNFLSGVKSHKI